MTKKQPPEQYAIGMVGLGVMGRNFLLNMADRGTGAGRRDLSAIPAALHRRPRHVPQQRTGSELGGHLCR
jgi:hypothetical protein